MKYGAIILFIILFMVHSGHGQDLRLEDRLLQLEKNSGVRIYYQKEWIDSLVSTTDIDGLSLAESLQALLEPHQIQFVILDNEVILTGNTKIITQPLIMNSFDQNASVEEIDKGLIFKRDYLGSENESIIQIGVRTELDLSSSSRLAGYITNLKGEPMEGVYVYLFGGRQGTISSADGFYSLDINRGRNDLYFQYVGFETLKKQLVIFSDGRLDVQMYENILALKEVTISSYREESFNSAQMGITSISAAESKNIPMVLGERDIVKVATSMPGVQVIGEGAAGINVRGGKPDQNAILLNGAPVYNTSHFFGFFSVFNSDLLDDVEIFKSFIPAKFDSRLSSVFNIRSKDARVDRFEVNGGISPVTSRVNIEIPIQEEKSGLIAGLRSTYSNWALKLVPDADIHENEITFFDFHAKYDDQVTENDLLTASLYFSNDKFRLPSDTLFSYSDYSFQNMAGSLIWGHRHGTRSDSELLLSYSGYGYELSYDQSPPNAFSQKFGLQETNFRYLFNYYPDENNEYDFGLRIRYLAIKPGERSPIGNESIISPTGIEEERGIAATLFVQNEFHLNENWLLNGQLKYSYFSKMGPGNTFLYEKGLVKDADSRIDTVFTIRGKTMKFFHHFEPSLSFRYLLNENKSLKFSYTRAVQDIHSLSNSASLSPTDIWKLSDFHIKPQISNQVSLGIYQDNSQFRYNFSAEIYYKKLRNLLDIKTGRNFIFNPAIETAVLQGEGKAYGLELQLRKSGKLNGWINYTYGRTFIQLEGNTASETINGGDYFPTSFDIPHSINVVSNFKFTKRVSTSLNVVYSSGRPVTYPTARYDYKGVPVVHYGNRNAYRIPDYFRVDFGLNIEAGHRIKKWVHNYWSVSVYNILGRDNAYSVFFEAKDGNITGYKLVVFGSPIPTITYNFRF